MAKGTILCLALFITMSSDAQRYKYIDSKKVLNVDAYRQLIKTQPDKRLVDLKTFIPGLILDIRYATANNFTHHRLYKQARAFARLPVAKALKQVEAELKLKGLGLKIYDAYRPYEVTVQFYEIAQDTNFVADPRKGSRHNRGCAIDLTIINLKTGKELEMPTGFDSFSPKAAANYINLPAIELQDRDVLKNAMEAHGFQIYRTEWWHYDFTGWEHFELLNVPFSAL